MSSDPSAYAKVVGFTPVFDSMVEDFGLVVAAVYGRVWRFAQGEDRVCWASVDTIANAVGLKRRIVQASLGRLADAGYLLREARVGQTWRYSLPVPPDVASASWTTHKAAGVTPAPDAPPTNGGEGGTLCTPPRHVVHPTPARGAGVPRHVVHPKIQAEDTPLRDKERNSAASQKFGEQFDFAVKHATLQRHVQDPSAYALRLLERGVRFRPDGSKLSGGRLPAADGPKDYLGDRYADHIEH